MSIKVCQRPMQRMERETQPTPGHQKFEINLSFEVWCPEGSRGNSPKQLKNNNKGNRRV